MVDTLAWVKYGIGHGYGAPHYAVDLDTPMGTPIGSAVAGIITVADYAVWNGARGGGEVFVRNDKGGPDWYVYHLDVISVKVGQHVQKGTLIGYSGGQNRGGNHPTDPAWSTGPHLHTGWFSRYVITAEGSRPYGPDFTPYLNQLRKNAGAGEAVPPLPSGSTTPLASTSLLRLFFSGADSKDVPKPWLDQVHDTLTSHEGFYAIALALDQAEQFPGYVNLASSPIDVTGRIRSIGATIGDNAVPTLIRGGLISLGMLLIGLLVAKIVMDQAQQKLDIVGKILPFLI